MAETFPLLGKQNTLPSRCSGIVPFSMYPQPRDLNSSSCEDDNIPTLGKKPTLSVFICSATTDITSPDDLWRCRGLFSDAILFDDIELHLSVQKQVNLISEMRSIAPDLQFFIATHSPYIYQDWFTQVVDVESLLADDCPRI